MDRYQWKELIEKKEKFNHELDRLLSSYLSKEEVKEVKQLLSNYYAEKVSREMDKLAGERDWTKETYSNWLNEPTKQ